ncbi:hypothetical protein ACEXQD_17390 [Herbiconiux sp. P15]|uniref:hypothetical protein n=1 Tax=Herbiconiux liukaitaii TaxID=3342799 RepID=UPI0035BA6A9C
MSIWDAIRVMNSNVEIEMRSDPTLVGEVMREQARHLAKNPALRGKRSIVEAQGIQGKLRLRPIDAMHELARGTALLRDPSVAAFARGWSALRYLGVFARSGQGRLSLDGAALEHVGPNQRRVISEELGIGFGVLVAKEWCQSRQVSPIGPITVIDVDMALFHNMVPGLSTTGKRQPDYLLAYPDPNKPSKTMYELLETKGTVDVSGAKGQLGRAVTQLAGLEVGGFPLTGIAVATVSTTSGIRALAVDPAEPVASWESSEAELEYWRKAKPRARPSLPVVDLPIDELSARATNVDLAALAEFSGQYDAATRWLPRLKGQPDHANSEERLETDLGEFVGTAFTLKLPGADKQVRVYQAVDAQIALALRSHDGSTVRARQRAFADRRGSSVRTTRSGDVEPSGVATEAVSSDGSLLRISIE